MESTCFASKGINSQQAVMAIGALARCAALYARTSVCMVGKGCDSLPAKSPELRARLARPCFTLLGSPLLDRLVSLQHVVIASWEGIDRWPSIPPSHELPAGMDPDAIDSKLTMQVGRTWAMPAPCWPLASPLPAPCRPPAGPLPPPCRPLPLISLLWIIVFQ